MKKSGIAIVTVIFCLFVQIQTSLAQSTEEKAKGLDDALPVAATERLSEVVFMPDGLTLAAIDEKEKAYAWSLPDLQAVPPPVWKRKYASDKPYDVTVKPPVVTTPMSKSVFQIAPPNETAWEWKYDKNAAIRLIGYEPHLKRLYYYEIIKGSEPGADNFSAKIFSVARDEKKPKLEGQTTLDKTVTLFISAEGKVLKYWGDYQYRLQDLNGQPLYTGERKVVSHNSISRQLDTPPAFVSTDGTRLIINNNQEKVVLRLSDGAELLHVDEKGYYRTAVDDNGRYAVYVFPGSKPGTLYGRELLAYRCKVYVIADEPKDLKVVWLSTPGAREAALADISAHDQQEREYLVREAARQEEAKRKAEQGNSSGNLDSLMDFYSKSAIQYIELSLQRYADAVKAPNSSAAGRCQALSELNKALKETKPTYDKVMDAKRRSGLTAADPRNLMLNLWQNLRDNYTSLVKDNSAGDGCKLEP